jgi:LysM repeat protein
VQRPARLGSPLRQVRNSSILAAMVITFAALLFVGFRAVTSSPDVAPSPTSSLQQAHAPPSPTVIVAVAEVAPSEGPPSSTPTPEPASTYRVIPGDTLTGIAAKLNVPLTQQAMWMQETMGLNGIVNAANLMSGQELRLPSLTLRGDALPPIQKPLNAVPTQVSLRPTPRPPAAKTPSAKPTPEKTPSHAGTPTRTPTPRPATIQKPSSRQN